VGQKYFFAQGKQTTNLASINITKLGALPIPLPPPHVQAWIVAELETQFSRLDDGVAQLKRVQANLKRYRASVLKAACEGKLVPTEAELARQEGRDYETGAQLLERILEERRKNWSGRGKYKEPAAPDTAHLPPLPEGWTWATFEQLSERVTVGFVGSMEHEYVPEGIPFLRGQNVRENRFEPEGLLYVSEKFHAQLSKSAIQPGDLAVVRSGAVGVTCVIPGTLPTANCSDLVLIQRPLGFLPEYGAYFMNSLAKRNVAAGKVGVALIHFNTRSVAELVVPLPPIEEQRRIVQETERRLSLSGEIEHAVESNLKRCKALRQSILHSAFSGKLAQKIDALPSARTVLSAEIVHRLYAERTLGRVKLAKIFHLCEHIAQLPEIQGQYRREAAGPFDEVMIKENIRQMEELQWYRETSELKEDGSVRKHSYTPLAHAGEHSKYLEQYWPQEKLDLVTQLIEEMRPWKTEQCEIISTTYAAWNDLLLAGQEPTEAAILHEILNNWHDSKRRIPESKWHEAIAWITNKGYVLGFGCLTRNSL
jgi:type I restriction enzyme S subunit